MVMGADTVRLPAASTATALTWYAAVASAPVVHSTWLAHVAPVHGELANITPAPQYSMRLSATLSLAVAATWMLLPVHTLSPGNVSWTVGAIVSPVVGVVFDTVTERVDAAVPPVESVAEAVSVTPPLALAAVFQVKLVLVPV